MNSRWTLHSVSLSKTFYTRRVCAFPLLPTRRGVKSSAVQTTSNSQGRKDSGPSPLSPLSRIYARGIPEERVRPRLDTTKERHKREKAPEIQYKPSKGLKNGPSSPRKLVVASTTRPSRVPIWARPASAQTQKVERPKAPGGVSWSEHRARLKERYPERWNPSKKVSREAMESMRELNKLDPVKYPSFVLAQRFGISPESARRILKSKWRMSEEEKQAEVEKERKKRAERIRAMKEEEMHQLVRAGIKLKVHPDDELSLR
ncbi:SubName: Full=Uncharacterized protein {ECO:0000313/EMBL:CCA72797.1} [Serendipita indica DSM 11827]|nr:SubName: Full=Uncharacterized protein {ECO:0000313/EMBL:CCA72797.1} [Serendipita indica DSM 11827]